MELYEGNMKASLQTTQIFTTTTTTTTNTPALKWQEHGAITFSSLVLQFVIIHKANKKKKALKVTSTGMFRQSCIINTIIIFLCLYLIIVNSWLTNLLDLFGSLPTFSTRPTVPILFYSLVRVQRVSLQVDLSRWAFQKKHGLGFSTICFCCHNMSRRRCWKEKKTHSSSLKNGR